VREIRVLAPGAQLSVLAEKAVLPPFGVCGGGSGATNRFWVRRADRPLQPSPLPGKVSGFPLEPGDLFVMESSGGGGFGDALERDPALVAADLVAGYVTPEAAEATYGVVLRAGAVDGAATTARRAALRSARVRVPLGAAADLAAGPGRSIRLSADTATRLGVSVGAIVELVNPDGAPLRAWVVSLVPGNGRRAEVAPAALGMLAIADGAEVEVRRVHGGMLAPEPGIDRR
jgi:N-methylhydantoinase B